MKGNGCSLFPDILTSLLPLLSVKPNESCCNVLPALTLTFWERGRIEMSEWIGIEAEVEIQSKELEIGIATEMTKREHN